MLVPSPTRRLKGGVEELAKADRIRIICRWRSTFGWRPLAYLKVNEFSYPKGHRLTQSERDAFDI